MRPLSRRAAAIVLAAMPLLAPGVAHADDGASVRSLDVRYDLATDGSMHVHETWTYDFTSEHHGMTRTILTAQDTDAGRRRHYPMTDLRVSSPSKAPEQTQVDDDGSSRTVRVGDPDRTVTGRQTYVLDYTLGHVLNAQPAAKSDELYWNVIGGSFELPIASARVSVHGPGASTRVSCHHGSTGSTVTCPARAGTTSTFTVGHLDAGDQLTVAEQRPAALFGTITPLLDPATTDADPAAPDRSGPAAADVTPSADTTNGLPFDVTLPDGTVVSSGTGSEPVASTGEGLLAGGLGVGTLALGIAGGRRLQRRDEQHADVAPGIAEPLARAEPVRDRPLAAVRFTPPDGVGPGLVGTLLDGRADAVDVSAIVVDLAVRGYLQIEEVPGGLLRRRDWRLTQLRPADGSLQAYEQVVLDGLFRRRPVVLMASLRGRFASTLARARSMLRADAAARGWYQQPTAAHRLLGLLLTVVPIVVAGYLAHRLLGEQISDHTGLAGYAVAFVALAAAALVGARTLLAAPARSALGTAVDVQARGVREYLLTAEADQIAHDEATTIFGRYLPYAIVFGCADRWVRLFGQVAAQARAQGVDIAAPDFFVASYGGDWSSFGSDLDSFTSTAASSFSSSGTSDGSSSGSSGGSSFSSSGSDSGSSGGGGGGGGGGSW